MDTFLTFLAVIFLGVAIGYFAWGIGYVVKEINASNVASTGHATPPSFNLQAAAALNYRGLLASANQSASATTSTSATVSSATTTVASSSTTPASTSAQ